MQFIQIWFVLLAVLSKFSEAQILFPTDETEVHYPNNFGECITPNRERSYCIYLKQCGDLYSLLQKINLSDNEKLYLRRSQCGYYEGEVLVCCPPRSSRPVMPPTTQTTPAPNIPSRGGSLLPQPGVCGIGSSDRIYGGNITRIDEYPWMALLEYSKPGNQRGFHCGGVLVNDRYVLTASHCVNGKAIPVDWRLASVRLGEWDLSTDQDCEGEDCSDPVVDVPIERAIPHEEYNPSSKSQYNDIALLRLSRSIPFTDWIKPICLPIASNLRSASYEGVSMDVVGWGKTEYASVSNIKLKAYVDGVSLDQCNQVYARQNVNLRNTQLCAGGVRGVDSCRGDSGGPLIGVDRSNKARPYSFLAGLVSFGPTPCGLEGWPGVYTRVGAYIDWIESHVNA